MSEIETALSIAQAVVDEPFAGMFTALLAVLIYQSFRQSKRGDVPSCQCATLKGEIEQVAALLNGHNTQQMHKLDVMHRDILTRTVA